MALNNTVPALEFRDVTLSFEGEVILQNVSFKIHEGEKFVLIGPSGQGKSVLLKLMAGLLTPTTGEVLVWGQPWLSLHGDAKQKILKDIGMLFQKNALFDSLTAGENVAFALRELSLSDESQIEAQVVKYLNQVGIGHAKSLYPDEISGGMQKRLGIARALALKPKMIFYDDPTAGLDPITSRKIIELILEAQQENQSTVIAVINDIKRVYQLADRIAMVVDKSVIITGNQKETQASQDPRVIQFINGNIEGPLTGDFT